MNPFTYVRATDPASAIRAGTRDGAKYLGGGTNLVDLMRERIERPSALIDVSSLSCSIEESEDGAILIGAGATNTAVASHPIVRNRFPLLSEAILNGASGQIRNMATAGGNLLQRTRCLYFYDEAARCNKREPGQGCDAIHGHNRMHAILGASDQCIATHPSDMCVALAALGAKVRLAGPGGERTIDFLDLHRLPGNTPHLDTNLGAGELITGLIVPAMPSGSLSAYRKVRERASYAFALVSVAAVLSVENGVVQSARLALGGVAHKPWRCLSAEDALTGRPAVAKSFEEAAAQALNGARPLAHNGFKVEMARRLIVATLTHLVRDEVRP